MSREWIALAPTVSKFQGLLTIQFPIYLHQISFKYIGHSNNVIIDVHFMYPTKSVPSTTFRGDMKATSNYLQQKQSS